MVYTTPHPDDDERLAAWRRRQAEDAVRSINIRLPLDQQTIRRKRARRARGWPRPNSEVEHDQP
jgi:hypothetical protein